MQYSCFLIPFENYNSHLLDLAIPFIFLLSPTNLHVFMVDIQLEVAKQSYISEFSRESLTVRFLEIKQQCLQMVLGCYIT